MNSLKQKIVEKLEFLPETALQEVLNFVDFLEWRKVTRKESEKSPRLEMDEDGSVEYVGGVLVVQAENLEVQKQGDLETSVQNLREERLRKLASW